MELASTHACQTWFDECLYLIFLHICGKSRNANHILQLSG